MGAADQRRNLYSPRNAGHLDRGEGRRRRRGLLFRAANIAAKHRREDLHVKHVKIAYSFASVQPTPSAPVQLSGHALMTFDKLDDTKRPRGVFTARKRRCDMFFAAIDRKFMR